MNEESNAQGVTMAGDQCSQTMKSAVVMGGARGVGPELVAMLARAGWHVIMSDESAIDVWIKTSEMADSFGYDAVIGRTTKMTDETSISRLAFDATKKGRSLDLWVNVVESLGDSKEVMSNGLRFAALADTNLKGLFWGISIAADQMRTQVNSGGLIINILVDGVSTSSSDRSAFEAFAGSVEGMSNNIAKLLESTSIKIKTLGIFAHTSEGELCEGRLGIEKMRSAVEEVLMLPHR